MAKKDKKKTKTTWDYAGDLSACDDAQAGKRIVVRAPDTYFLVAQAFHFEVLDMQNKFLYTNLLTNIRLCIKKIRENRCGGVVLVI